MRIRFPAYSFAILLAAIGVAQAQTTGTTGGNQPFENMQPSLAVTQSMVQRGIYPARASESPNATSIGNTWGFVYNFAGNYVPFGTFSANGQLLSIAQNTELFSLLGTSYGGNGTTNFALPNLIGTAAVGSGNGPGLSPWTVGQTSGSPTVTLTAAQLPAHNHALPGGGVTGATGGGQPFNNVQPSLALTPVIATNPGVPDVGSNNSVFVGQVANFAGTFVPGGWKAANGDILPISGNQALFDVIGNKYGGDGVTTFALPDLRGRAAVGADANHPLGLAFGNELTTLTAAQMPAHNHTVPSDVTGNIGGSTPVSNFQPSLALNYIIALQGIFPGKDGGAGFREFDATLGQIVEFAGDVIPRGWALADGSLLSIGQNSALFSLFGFAYGGNGTTTFALPDFRGRTMIGADYLAYGLGAVLGTDSNVLTVANLAAHNHSLEPGTPPGGEVPIPASVALFATGLGVIGFVARRKKQKSKRPTCATFVS